MSSATPSKSPVQPSKSDTVTLEYHSTRGGKPNSLTGEVVDVTPLPGGWKASVDTYDGVRLQVKVEGETAIVSSRKVGGNGKYTRIGFADVSEWDP